jgi:uncharacterized membrane protein
MLPKLTNPSALFLLAFLPLLYWWCRKSLSGLSRTRQVMALVLRTSIMLLLILALARLHAVRESDDLCVYFVLDQSRSIPADLRTRAFDYVNEANDPKGSSGQRKNDKAGLIVFGANAGIETSPCPLLAVKDIRTVLNLSTTDIAGALRLALAAFPEGMQKRIVLVSDGNENRGNAVVEAQNAAASGTVIDVLPLEYARGAEVLVDKVILPSQVLPDEEFEIKIVIQSFQTARGKLWLFVNGNAIASQDVEVFPDRPNVFTVTRTLAEPDFYTFKAVIEPEPGADTIMDNNHGYGFVDVKGDPKILIATDDPKKDRQLAAALIEEGLRVELKGMSEIPIEPAEMQRWDLLILSNVPAAAMTGGKNSQMAMVRDAVRTSGIGLIMIGGDNGFGAGGYKGTEIEEALPVDMDVRQRKLLPSGALVLVMDAVEFQNGNAWAREICKAALDGISTRDQIGVVTTEWAIPLKEAADKADIRAQISRLQPMDVAPDGGVPMAYEALKKATAGVKHVVVVSDSGFCNGQSYQTVDAMLADKITVSAVCIGPHTPAMTQSMQTIAERGGGAFYFPQDPEALPQIFFKEAAVVKKSLIWEKEPFVPKLEYTTAPLSGVSATSIPALRGYVVTTAKNSPLVEVPLLSDNGDPILAHWRYGLGKSVAFTSDAKNRWAVDWVSWGHFSSVWAQVVRWSMRPRSGWDYTVQTRIEGSDGRIVVDAVNEKGEFQNFLNLAGTITSPDIKTLDIKLSQTGPGRYEGTFHADREGTYIVNLSESDKEGAAPFRTGVAVSYSPEYRQFETNHPLLKQLVAVTGGRMLKTTDNVFEHNLQPMKVSKPLWPMLLLIALCIFPFDVFVRRVMIDYDRVLLALQPVLARLPLIGARWRHRPAPQQETMERLMRRKREVRLEQQPRVAPREFAQLGEAGEPGEGKMPPTAGPGPGARPSPAPKPPSAEPQPASYTQRLLEAKKRAMKKH